MTHEEIDTIVRAWARKAVATISLGEHRRERVSELLFTGVFTTLITILVVIVTVRWYGPMEAGSPSQIVATLAILIGVSVLVTKVVQENWAFTNYEQIGAITGSDILHDLEYRQLTTQQKQLLTALLHRLREWSEHEIQDQEVRNAIAALVREMHESPHWYVHDMLHWRIVTEACRYHQVTDSIINPYRELGW
jgi:hypothetical protein